MHLIDGYLVPELYSTPTDSHEYLNPDSAHPPMVLMATHSGSTKGTE